jgi:septal ring factor EnvC (AmiA/AmiB activator)
MLVASSVVLLALLLYVMFVSYLPAKQRLSGLETELKEVYAREAALQTRLAQQEQRSSQRDQQLNALRAEREALSRRLEELEKQLGGAQPRRR